MLLGPVIPKKPSVKVLSNVFLKDGKVTASDLDRTVTLDLPEATGELLLPYKAVYELIKYVPGHEVLTIDEADKKISLTWDSGSASYANGQTAEYPDIPSFELKAKGNLDGDVLVKALTDLVGYCAVQKKNEAVKLTLTGVALFLGESIDVWAADGFRLATKHMDGSFPMEEAAIIPAETVQLLGHLWSKLPTQVNLTDTLVGQIMSKRELRIGLNYGDPLHEDKVKPADKMVIRFGRLTIITKLIEGNVPDYKRYLVANQPLKIRIIGRELETGLRRLRNIAKSGSNIARMVWDDTTLTLTASSEDVGEVSVKIPINTEGGPGRVAINLDYLMDYIKGKDGLVTFSADKPSTPVIIHYSNTPTVILMPMSVKWGDEPPTEEQPTNQVNEQPENQTAEQPDEQTEEQTVDENEDGTDAESGNEAGGETTEQPVE